MRTRRKRSEPLTGAALTLLMAFAAGAQPADPLARAIEALGGPSALQRAESLSAVLVGVDDLQVIGEGTYPDRPALRPRQEIVLVDWARKRIALRGADVSSEGNPEITRWVVDGERGWRYDVLADRSLSLESEQTAALRERLLWSVPHLALAEMQRHRDQLRCSETRTLSGRPHDVCSFRGRWTVLFDRQTGLLSAYEYSESALYGPRTVRYQFKEWVPSGAGLYPSGYQLIVGTEVFRDLTLVDARPPAGAGEHSWFASAPSATATARQTAAIETLAPGVGILGLPGGQRVLFAEVESCIAVFDAPAREEVIGPVPSPAAKDPGAEILTTLQKATGKKVCYAVPTHHHPRHFGIAPFAQAGAAILTTPGNLTLARQVLAGAGVSSLAVRTVRERQTLGSGKNRVDLWVMRGDPHADEMILIHLPGHGLAFQADLTGSVLSRRSLRRFIAEKELKIDRLYGAHLSRPITVDDLMREDLHAPAAAESGPALH